jgi:hypothetical protein
MSQDADIPAKFEPSTFRIGNQSVIAAPNRWARMVSYSFITIA